MAKTKFPIVVKRGAASVKIYHTPDTQKAGLDGKPVSYDAFTLSYFFGGKRIRRKFSDLAEARTEAENAVTAIANGAMDTRVLSTAEVSEYCDARETLSRLNITLPSAIHEFVAAKQAADSVNLVQAAQFFKRYGGDKITRQTVPDLFDALLALKRAEGAGAYHINDLDTRAGKFQETFTGFIDEITTDQINAWLTGLGLEPRTQNNYRAAVVQLFNFAKTKAKALPHWLPHAADDAMRVKEAVKDTELYTPEEMLTIMRNAPIELVPALAIRAFSGIRNEELFKLSWQEVDLEGGWIKLRSATTKLRARRLIPIPENLREWLTPHLKKNGPFQPGYASAKTLSEAISHAISATGTPVKRNALRNCYTSYRMAILGDVAKVAEETGNSPQMIRENYLELVTPKEAEAWFAIKPLPAASATADTTTANDAAKPAPPQTKRRKASA